MSYGIRQSSCSAVMASFYVEGMCKWSFDQHSQWYIWSATVLAARWAPTYIARLLLYTALRISGVKALSWWRKTNIIEFVTIYCDEATCATEMGNGGITDTYTIEQLDFFLLYIRLPTRLYTTFWPLCVWLLAFKFSRWYHCLSGSLIYIHTNYPISGVFAARARALEHIHVLVCIKTCHRRKDGLTYIVANQAFMQDFLLEGEECMYSKLENFHS